MPRKEERKKEMRGAGVLHIAYSQNHHVPTLNPEREFFRRRKKKRKKEMRQDGALHIFLHGAYQKNICHLGS